MKSNVVYAMYDRESRDCLYVGSTINYRHRICQHKIDARKRMTAIYVYINSQIGDWETVEFKILLDKFEIDSKMDLYKLENDMLQLYKPIFNSKSVPFFKK